LKGGAIMDSNAEWRLKLRKKYDRGSSVMGSGFSSEYTFWLEEQVRAAEKKVEAQATDSQLAKVDNT
jgi:hypothetical protein